MLVASGSLSAGRCNCVTHPPTCRAPFSGGRGRRHGLRAPFSSDERHRQRCHRSSSSGYGHRHHDQRHRQQPCGPVRAQPQDFYSEIPSSEGDGEYDGPNLVPMNVESEGGLGGTSDEVFGPPAALLVGFTQDEFETFRAIMIDMEADFVKMMACSPAMLEGTLQEAMSGPAPLYEQLPMGTRRAVLLCGMNTAEVMEVIGCWRDTESLPETLWGAAVPRNWDRNLRLLIDEMYDDAAHVAEQERRTEP